MVKLIEVEVEGLIAVARLLEEKAPRTVNMIWNALPIERMLYHARWSGNMAYFREPGLEDPLFVLENRISYLIPGDVAYIPAYGEFAFSFGQAQARDSSGNCWASHFASFEGDFRLFLEKIQQTQCDGAKKIVIRRKEG